MVIQYIKALQKKFNSILNSIFKKKENIKLGLYGPVNAGKTSLANRISMDWLGEELGKVSSIPHETREIQMKEHVEMQHDGKKLIFNLLDTPGIATKIDFEDFVRRGLKRKKAKERAKEATKGVIEAIKWLDNMDAVLVVMDSTKDPLTQVNITILGNLEERGIPFMIVGNKTDLRSSNVTRIRNAFPEYKVVGISAKKGQNTKQFYKEIFEMMR